MKPITFAVAVLLAGCSGSHPPRSMAEFLGLPLAYTTVEGRVFDERTPCSGMSHADAVACYLDSQQIDCQSLLDRQRFAEPGESECVEPMPEVAPGIQATCYEEYPVPVSLVVAELTDTTERREAAWHARATCCSEGVDELPLDVELCGAEESPWSMGVAYFHGQAYPSDYPPGHPPPPMPYLRRYRHFIVDVGRLTEESRELLEQPPQPWTPSTSE